TSYFVVRALAWTAAILAVAFPLAVARYRRGGRGAGAELRSRPCPPTPIAASASRTSWRDRGAVGAKRGRGRRRAGHARLAVQSQRALCRAADPARRGARRLRRRPGGARDRAERDRPGL